MLVFPRVKRSTSRRPSPAERSVSPCGRRQSTDPQRWAEPRLKRPVVIARWRFCATPPRLTPTGKPKRPLTPSSMAGGRPRPTQSASKPSKASRTGTSRRSASIPTFKA